jgi:hypothetical protein
MAINKSGDFIATGDLRGNTHVLKLDEYWQIPRHNELGNVKKVIIVLLLFGLFFVIFLLHVGQLFEAYGVASQGEEEGKKEASVIKSFNFSNEQGKHSALVKDEQKKLHVLKGNRKGQGNISCILDYQFKAAAVETCAETSSKEPQIEENTLMDDDIDRHFFDCVGINPQRERDNRMEIEQ